MRLEFLTGRPADYVEALLDLCAAMKAGKADLVTDTVEKVAGRKPLTFEAWVRRNIAAFKERSEPETSRRGRWFAG